MEIGWAPTVGIDDKKTESGRIPMIPRKPKAKPGPSGLLANWIEANVCLADGFVAEPGPMRLYPYQRQIADCLGDESIERVTVLKAARVGYSSFACRRARLLVHRRAGADLGFASD
jgi:hypothetical protein